MTKLARTEDFFLVVKRDIKKKYHKNLLKIIDVERNNIFWESICRYCVCESFYLSLLCCVFEGNKNLIGIKKLSFIKKLNYLKKKLPTHKSKSKIY